MTAKEFVELLKDSRNWTDDFLEEHDREIVGYWNRIRAVLAPLGKYEAFDRAYSERKKPGQVAMMAAAETVKKKSLEGFEGFEGFEIRYRNQDSTFPHYCFPSVAASYSVQIEESLQVVNEMVSPALLGISSLCMRGEYCISPKKDWKEPLNLYILIVNRPSEKKTPVLKEVLAPAFEYVDKINKERQPEINEYQLKKKILNGKIKHAMDIITKNPKQSKNTKDPIKTISEDEILMMQNELTELEENAVKPMTLLADDVTTEALVMLLNDNDERIGIASAEGGIFGMLAGRYTNQPNIDIFLKGYSGESYTSHRASGRVEVLKEPLISLVLMVQPTVLKEALNNKEFRERGLMARFLYSMPGSKIGKRRYKTVAIDEKVRQGWHDLIFELLDMHNWEHEKVIYLSDEADKLGEEFFNEIETELYSEYEDMEDWIGKLYGQTMRIAGVLHVMEYRLRAGEIKVEAKTMKNAIEIARWYLGQAKTVFIECGMYDPPEVKDAKYIIKRIDSTGKTIVSKRDLFQLCKDKKRFATAEDIKPGLKALVEHGYIRIFKSFPSPQNPQNPQNSQKGGRPSEMIELNPEYIKYRDGQKPSRIQEPEKVLKEMFQPVSRILEESEVIDGELLPAGVAILPDGSRSYINVSLPRSEWLTIPELVKEMECWNE